MLLKVQMKMSSAKWQLFCPSINVSTHRSKGKLLPFCRRHCQMHVYFAPRIQLTYLPLVPHICVGELDQRWFRWWLGHILSLALVGTNFSDIRLAIHNFSFMEMHLKISSAKMAAILSRGRWVNSKPEQATWHYLNQWWPGLLTQICATSPRIVNWKISYGHSPIS